jgi:hypothetical protein
MRHLTRVAAALGAAALTLALPAAAQAAACPTPPTTQSFLQFGDSAPYAPVANGHFESGTAGWTLNGASATNGNEPWFIRSAGDTKSLAISPTGTAVSAPICVDVQHPDFRFFARRTSGTWGVLNVRLRWQDAGGQTHETTVASINGGTTAWQVTPPLTLAGTLPLWADDDSLNVRLVFDPEDWGGAWTIDDVQVDPFARG